MSKLGHKKWFLLHHVCKGTQKETVKIEICESTYFRNDQYITDYVWNIKQRELDFEYGAYCTKTIFNKGIYFCPFCGKKLPPVQERLEKIEKIERTRGETAPQAARVG